MDDQGDPSSLGSFKGIFSFVNMNADSIRRKEHDPAVAWHVQYRYERWKKQQRAERHHIPVNMNSSNPSPGSHSPSLLSLTMGGRVLDEATQLDPSLKQRKLSTDLVDIPVSSMSAHRSVPTLSGQFLSQLSTSVPFDSTTVTDRLMTFAYHSLIPSAWPSITHYPLYELKRSMDCLAVHNKDQCYFNALFAVIAFAMAHTTSGSYNIGQLQKLALLFQARAMLSLRRGVQRQQDMRHALKLEAILLLFTSETLAENSAAARVHLKMLRYLIVEAGGVISLDSWFKENLVSGDAYFALRYGSLPQFPASEWTPGPLSYAWRTHICTALRVNSARDAPEVDRSIEDRTLREIFVDLRELLLVDDYIANYYHSLPTDEPLLRWRQLRKFDCISRLASHFMSCTIFPSLHADPLIQRCICTAATLWAGLVFGQPEPVRLGSKLLVDLARTLREGKKSEEVSHVKKLSTYDSLWLWVADLGVKAGKTLPGVSGEKAWFQQTLYNQKLESGLGNVVDGHSETALHHILRKFLYSDRLQTELDGGARYREVDVRKGIYTISGVSWRAPLKGTGTWELEMTE